jgi:glycosyltransferase involved in cell wall biosynthesis
MNLLVFNQKLDTSDTDLEVTFEWVNALAARVASVWVITHERGEGVLPANVHVLSIGRESGFGRPRKVLRFYAALHRVLGQVRIDACFVHMVPVFAVMAAPILKARGIPMVQWYTHSATSLTLRVAVALVDRVATASRESLSFSSPKITATGHGIDTSRFRPAARRRDGGPFQILSVGRLSPIKRHDRLLDAVAILRSSPRSVSLTVIGEPHGPGGDRWFEQLRAHVADLALAESVSFVGGVRRSDLAAWYNRADVCVNLSETNSLDKVLLEAMSCGVPVITSNPAFAPLLDDLAPRLMLPDSSPQTIADALLSLMALDAHAVERLEHALRGRVVERHDLQKLMDRLVSLMSELGRSARRHEA